MKYQSLPKNLSIRSKVNQRQGDEPIWSTYLRPIDQSMPEHSFQCKCEMCHDYQHKKFKEIIDQQTKLLTSKIKARIAASNSSRQQTIQQNSQWILKRLMVPTHKIANNGLALYISQTLFFKDGQATEFYLSKQLEDPTIKKISKQKLTNQFIQKVMSDRRRKYKDYIRLKTGRKKAQQKKKLLFGQKQVKKQIKDAVLIRYVDGYQQLLTENQFLSISLRRKQDPIWKQISSIRNFINITNPQQQNSFYYVVKFERKKIKDLQLFQRSKTLMKVYGQYVTADDNKYISQQEQLKFVKNLQNTNLKLYAEYLVYQIVNFIQYFYDEQINVVVIGIYFDQIGHPFLNQVYKLQIQSLIKFQWTNQIYRKRMDEQQAKILTTKQITNSSAFQQGANGIVTVMQQAYQKMRDRLGLNAQDEDDKQEVANNNFFKTLHPGFNQNISDVLKDGNLTISQFKKVYLGYKPKKKPIIKQFTSNMIKTIHLTSPKLNTSNPHQYIESPNKNKIGFRSQRKKESILLSPLKIDLNRKLYQTLPVKQLN